MDIRFTEAYLEFCNCTVLYVNEIALEKEVCDRIDAISIRRINNDETIDFTIAVMFEGNWYKEESTYKVLPYEQIEDEGGNKLDDTTGYDQIHEVRECAIKASEKLVSQLVSTHETV